VTLLPSVPKARFCGLTTACESNGPSLRSVTRHLDEQSDFQSNEVMEVTAFLTGGLVGRHIELEIVELQDASTHDIGAGFGRCS